MAFAKSLHDHKMRFQIDFDDITNDYHIYGDLTQSDSSGNTVRDNTTVFYTDPRFKKMGSRIITSKALPTDKSLEDYHSNRIQLAVPDAAYDCKLGKTISGELCLEYLNGVDYKKGCYMGQEMTARTHFRNPPKKRIVAIRYEGEAPPHGTQIKLGKLPVGEVYSCQNGYGIGIARVSKALEDSANLTADGKPLKAEKPQWADYIIE